MRSFAAALPFLLALGCAHAPPPLPPPQPPTPPAPAEPTPAERFRATLASLSSHDAARDWTPPLCASVAHDLVAFGQEHPAVAAYDAALAHLRCGEHREAILLFEGALRLDPSLDAARFSLALARAADASERGDALAAERSLGEGLYLDETSASALRRLAFAEIDGASHASSPNRARLESALAVAERAVRLSPNEAQSHLTLGLAEAALGDYPRALASLDRARALDPELFEAHASAAALRLRVRDLDASAAAYRDALRVRPTDYDAQLGLAIALRGTLDHGDEATWEARFLAAQQAIDATLALLPDRPEAHLSAALLALDHGTRTTSSAREQAMLVARRQFRAFLTLAGTSPAFARQRQIAEAGAEAIRDATECDFGTSESVRKQREVEARTRAAEEEARPVE